MKFEWIAFADRFPRDKSQIYILCDEEGEEYRFAKLDWEYVEEYEDQQNPPKCWYFVDADEGENLEVCEGDMGFWVYWAILPKCDKGMIGYE